MSDTILVKSVEDIYPEWAKGECKLFDGLSEVDKVVSRGEGDRVSYIVWLVGGEWRHAIGSDQLRVEWVEEIAQAFIKTALPTAYNLKNEFSIGGVPVWSVEDNIVTEQGMREALQKAGCSYINIENPPPHLMGNRGATTKAFFIVPRNWQPATSAPRGGTAAADDATDAELFLQSLAQRDADVVALEAELAAAQERERALRATLASIQAEVAGNTGLCASCDWVNERIQAAQDAASE